MKRFVKLLSILILLSLFLSASVLAQEYDEEKTRFRITPRIWFSYVDLAGEDESSTEMFSLPLYGATLSVTPKSTPNTNFLLTALYGEGEGDHVVFWAPPPFNEGELEAERLDLELLIRYNFPGRNFSFFAGPRYVIFDEKESVPGYTAETDSEVWLVEVGLGTFANMSEDGRHRLFGNFTFGLGYLDWEFQDTDGFMSSDSFVSPTIDFNFGYQYTIGASISLSLRYRLFMIISEAEVLDGFEQLKLDTIHGPELAFTVTF